MSIRGQRGGRGSGRGRGRGKTMLWEWERYKPDPSVYDNIWHIRQAPVAITPRAPNDPPLHDARTRILERRQTEDGYGRNFYFVEITYLGAQEPTSTWVQSSDNSKSGTTEVERVDVSRILNYVSPRELERFENEQFRIEAEAEAITVKEEQEEHMRKRMERNARTAGSGRGRGGHMLSSVGIDPELHFTGTTRGRPQGSGRGHGRGRGRGRRRGNWRGTSGIMLGGASHRELPQDEIVDSQPSRTVDHRLAAPHHEIAETDVESEEADFDGDLPEPHSLSLMHSAFVANSALPLSSVLPKQRAPPLKPLQNPYEISDIDDSPTDYDDALPTSIPNGAMPRGFEIELDNIENRASASGDGSDDMHRSKRQKTQSEEPHQELMFPPSSPHEVLTLESEDDSIPPGSPSTVLAPRTAAIDGSRTNSETFSPPPPPESTNKVSSSEAEGDAEEYVVEDIIEHYYNDEGKKYYLVKWEGYQDSHDWLLEEDLAGASELVAGYNERVRRRKKKDKVV